MYDNRLTRFSQCTAELITLELPFQRYRSPLIGLELVAFTEGRRKMYLCCLCDRRGEEFNMVSHLITVKHRLAYMRRYFPMVCTALSRFPFHEKYRRGVSEVLAIIANAMEREYGRLQPFVLNEAALMSKDAAVCDLVRAIAEGHFHYPENNGYFASLVDFELIEHIRKRKIKGLRIDDESDEIKHISAGRGYSKRHVIHTMHSGTLKYDVPMRKKLYNGAGKIIDVINIDVDICEEVNAPKNGEDVIKKNIEVIDLLEDDDRDGLVTSLLPPAPVKEDEKIGELHKEEWERFWKKRYREIMAKGIDASKHDFKSEWGKYWAIGKKELKDGEKKTILSAGSQNCRDATVKVSKANKFVVESVTKEQTPFLPVVSAVTNRCATNVKQIEKDIESAAVDRLGIAKQIAETLVDQGRTDLTDDDLKEVISFVVEMASSESQLEVDGKNISIQPSLTENGDASKLEEKFAQQTQEKVDRTLMKPVAGNAPPIGTPKPTNSSSKLEETKIRVDVEVPKVDGLQHEPVTAIGLKRRCVMASEIEKKKIKADHEIQKIVDRRQSQYVTEQAPKPNSSKLEAKIKGDEKVLKNAEISQAVNVLQRSCRTSEAPRYSRKTDHSKPEEGKYKVDEKRDNRRQLQPAVGDSTRRRASERQKAEETKRKVDENVQKQDDRSQSKPAIGNQKSPHGSEAPKPEKNADFSKADEKVQKQDDRSQPKQAILNAKHPRTSEATKLLNNANSSKAEEAKKVDEKVQKKNYRSQSKPAENHKRHRGSEAPKPERNAESSKPEEAKKVEKVQKKDEKSQLNPTIGNSKHSRTSEAPKIAETADSSRPEEKRKVDEKMQKKEDRPATEDPKREAPKIVDPSQSEEAKINVDQKVHRHKADGSSQPKSVIENPKCPRCIEAPKSEKSDDSSKAVGARTKVDEKVQKKEDKPAAENPKRHHSSEARHANNADFSKIEDTKTVDAKVQRSDDRSQQSKLVTGNIKRPRTSEVPELQLQPVIVNVPSKISHTDTADSAQLDEAKIKFDDKMENKDESLLPQLEPVKRNVPPETPNPATSTDEDEPLNDHDLQTLLQNFQSLSDPEKTYLTGYMKKLKLIDPLRVARLKIKIASKESSIEPSEPISPLSMKIGLMNPVNPMAGFEVASKLPKTATKRKAETLNVQNKKALVTEDKPTPESPNVSSTSAVLEPADGCNLALRDFAAIPLPTDVSSIPLPADVLTTTTPAGPRTQPAAPQSTRLHQAPRSHPTSIASAYRFNQFTFMESRGTYAQSRSTLTRVSSASKERCIPRYCYGSPQRKRKFKVSLYPGY